MDRLVEFRQSLAEAVTWVQLHFDELDPEYSLRNSEFDECVNPYVQDRAIPSRSDNCPIIMECVRRIRRRKLEAAGHVYSPALPMAPQGRLLAYWPDWTLSHGAAWEVTHGFFYYDDSPPVGSWVWFDNEPMWAPRLGGYLLSWVPGSIIDRVTAAIEEEPTECIQWSCNLNSPLLLALRSAHILDGDSL
jgi:hypothetical protein